MRARNPHELTTDFELICRWRDESPPVPWRTIAERISERYGEKISHVALFKQYYRILGEREEKAREVHISEQMGEIQYWKMELLEAWQKSKQPKQSRKLKGAPGKSGGKGDKFDADELTITTEEQIGDMSIVGQYIKLLERESKLLGLDAPVKRALTDDSGASDDGTEGIVVIRLPDNGRSVDMSKLKPGASSTDE